MKNLIKQGLGEERATMSAFNQKGPWFNSGTSHMTPAVNVKDFREMGLFSLLENCELIQKEIYLRNLMSGGVRGR